MLGREFKRASRSRRTKPLVVRGGLARTFGGFASFLAVIFLAWGSYILDDAFANPIAAEAAAVIGAAFSIALATILFFYLLKPGKHFNAVVPQDPSRVVSLAKQPILREPSRIALRREIPEGLGLSAYLRGPLPHTASRSHLTLRARNRREIALLQNDAVMHLVAGSDES